MTDTLCSIRELGKTLNSIVCVILVAIPITATAVNYGFYYPYVTPYYFPGQTLHYGYPNRAEINLEIARLRREIRRSRIQQNSSNARQEQAFAMQQQAFKEQRARGRQACFDRSTGGFEICADLFADQKDELQRCDALVIQRNPSCNDVPLKGAGQLPTQAPE